MNDHDTERLITAVSETIQKTVNGKIDKLHARFDQHEKEFVEFREEMQPILDFMHGASVTKKLILWITGLIIGIFGAVAAVQSVLK